MLSISFWCLIILMTCGAWLLIAVPLWKDRPRKKLSKIVLVTFPVVALCLYFFLGNSQQLRHFWMI